MSSGFGNVCLADVIAVSMVHDLEFSFQDE